MDPHPQSAREEDQEKAYKVYLTERADLIRCGAAGSHAFDKTLTSLSAGAIAFSLTYVQVFLQNLKGASVTGLLYSSWALFLLALIVILTSFLTSQRAYTHQIEIVEKVFLESSEREDEEQTTAKNGWRTATTALNLISFFAFVAGVVALSVFAVLNLPK